MDNPKLDLNVNRNLNFLHPDMEKRLNKMLTRCREAYLTKETPYVWRVFEGWRHPSRQLELFRARTTKAKPFESAHQFGLAADIVPCRPYEGDLDLSLRSTLWTWSVKDEDWDFMRNEAFMVGLNTPIPWDKPHLEHPDWQLIRQTMNGIPFHSDGLVEGEP